MNWLESTQCWSYCPLTKAYNVDTVDQFKAQCRDLLELWPDIMSDDPLLIRDGGQEVGWWSLSCHWTWNSIFYWRLHQPFLWSYQNLLTKSLNICFGIKSFNVLSMVELLNVSHHGLCQAPFNATHYNTAMATDRVDKKVYKCGQNWWRHNLIWSPNPGAARLIIFGATWWYGGWKKSCTS